MKRLLVLAPAWWRDLEARVFANMRQEAFFFSIFFFFSRNSSSRGSSQLRFDGMVVLEGIAPVQCRCSIRVEDYSEFSPWLLQPESHHGTALVQDEGDVSPGQSITLALLVSHWATFTVGWGGSSRGDPMHRSQPGSIPLGNEHGARLTRPIDGVHAPWIGWLGWKPFGTRENV